MAAGLIRVSRVLNVASHLYKGYAKKWRQRRRSWGKRSWEGAAEVSSVVGRITGKNTNAYATNSHFRTKKRVVHRQVDFTNSRHHVLALCFHRYLFTTLSMSLLVVLSIYVSEMAFIKIGPC